MKTYKQLVDELYEEVSKIDVSKLSLNSYSSGGLKEYVELLKSISSLPRESYGDKLDMCCSLGFGGALVPKYEESKTE